MRLLLRPSVCGVRTPVASRARGAAQATEAFQLLSACFRGRLLWFLRVRLLVSVGGGADSVALLRMLLAVLGDGGTALSTFQSSSRDADAEGLRARWHQTTVCLFMCVFDESNLASTRPFGRKEDSSGDGNDDGGIRTITIYKLKHTIYCLGAWMKR